MSTTSLSPSIHELTIARHMKGDDPILQSLHDGVKLARELAAKASTVTDAVMANPMRTEAMRHREARNAAFSLIERATTALDQALKAATDEIKIIRVRISGPPPAKDERTETKQRELRERLSMLPEERRRTIINEAIKNDDDLLVGAVLHMPDWVSGLGATDLAMYRHNWATRRYPADLDRLDRIEKAVIDAKRVGELTISFVDRLTDAKLIKEAEQNEKAANDALREAKQA